jgi:uncharacterized membrane protein YgdD (TMEM256/DUF423 family)
MWVTVAALLGASAVALGAYGTHGLRGRVPDAAVGSWETASDYHLLHALVVLTLALYGRASGSAVGLPAALLTAGVLLFSGSIYLLVLTPWRWLGPVTPLGGVALIAGWLAVLVLARPPQAR